MGKEKEYIKSFAFKTLPIEIEVKNLHFVRELPRLLGQPHKAAFYQFIWLTEGCAHFHIDFRPVTVQANEVLILSAGQVCQFDTASLYEGKIILFTSSFFSVTEQDANFLHTSEVLNPVHLNKIVGMDRPWMEQLFTLLDRELTREADHFQLPVAQSYLRVILLETERVLAGSRPVVHDNLGRRFCNEVERHFRTNRSTEFYLHLLGVNEKSLSREVKALSGKTPKAYLDSRVVLEAKRLLCYSNLSTKEVGFELGFDEPTNFTKYFRKHTGITPGTFRSRSRS